MKIRFGNVALAIAIPGLLFLPACGSSSNKTSTSSNADVQVTGAAGSVTGTTYLSY